jgi:hypothetical protein
MRVGSCVRRAGPVGYCNFLIDKLTATLSNATTRRAFRAHGSGAVQAQNVLGRTVSDPRPGSTDRKVGSSSLSRCASKNVDGRGSELGRGAAGSHHNRLSHTCHRCRQAVLPLPSCRSTSDNEMAITDVNALEGLHALLDEAYGLLSTGDTISDQMPGDPYRLLQELRTTSCVTISDIALTRGATNAGWPEVSRHLEVLPRAA